VYVSQKVVGVVMWGNRSHNRQCGRVVAEGKKLYVGVLCPLKLSEVKKTEYMRI
jgi:hypothetical protein